MKQLRVLLVAIALSVGISLGTSSVAGAGGWANATFDELPALEAGETVEIGFTVRQHGVTLVDAGEFMSWASGPRDRIGVTVTDSSGDASFFPARPSNRAQGHFVAHVEVPDAATITVSAEMGAFGTSAPFEAAVGADGGGAGWFDEPPAWLGIVLPAIGGMCLLIVLADLASGRRRGHRSVAGAAAAGAGGEADAWLVDPPAQQG